MISVNNKVRNSELLNEHHTAKNLGHTIYLNQVSCKYVSLATGKLDKKCIDW